MTVLFHWDATTSWFYISRLSMVVLSITSAFNRVWTVANLPLKHMSTDGSKTNPNINHKHIIPEILSCLTITDSDPTIFFLWIFFCVRSETLLQKDKGRNSKNHWKGSEYLKKLYCTYHFLKKIPSLPSSP